MINYDVDENLEALLGFTTTLFDCHVTILVGSLATVATFDIRLTPCNIFCIQRHQVSIAPWNLYYYPRHSASYSRAEHQDLDKKHGKKISCYKIDYPCVLCLKHYQVVLDPETIHVPRTTMQEILCRNDYYLASTHLL